MSHQCIFSRKQMANDFIAALSKLEELEEPEEPEDEPEEPEEEMTEKRQIEVINLLVSGKF